MSTQPTHRRAIVRFCEECTIQMVLQRGSVWNEVRAVRNLARPYQPIPRAVPDVTAVNIKRAIHADTMTQAQAFPHPPGWHYHQDILFAQTDYGNWFSDLAASQLGMIVSARNVTRVGLLAFGFALLWNDPPKDRLIEYAHCVDSIIDWSSDAIPRHQLVTNLPDAWSISDYYQDLIDIVRDEKDQYIWEALREELELDEKAFAGLQHRIKEREKELAFKAWASRSHRLPDGPNVWERADSGPWVIRVDQNTSDADILTAAAEIRDKGPDQLVEWTLPPRGPGRRPISESELEALQASVLRDDLRWTWDVVAERFGLKTRFDDHGSIRSDRAEELVKRGRIVRARK